MCVPKQPLINWPATDPVPRGCVVSLAAKRKQCCEMETITSRKQCCQKHCCGMTVFKLHRNCASVQYLPLASPKNLKRLHLGHTVGDHHSLSHQRNWLQITMRLRSAVSTSYALLFTPKEIWQSSARSFWRRLQKPCAGSRAAARETRTLWEQATMAS